MSSDALLATAAPGIKTANFATAGVVLGKARIQNSLYMRVLYTQALNASGANSWTFECDLSLDGGSTWFEISGTQPIVCTTVAQAGELYLEVDLDVPTINAAMANNPQVRCQGILSGAGSGATITVGQIDIVPAWS